jgi:hypothetical protein
LRGGWTAAVVAAALVLAAVLVFAPGRRHQALDAFVLALGALGVAAGVRATRAAAVDVHEPALTAELADPLDVLPERPLELEKLERDVYLSLGTAFHLHHRLRPLLRDIAATRLRLRRGVDLATQPDRAERLLGEPAWSWLRSDREAPRDRWAHGPDVAELEAIVDALERI